MNKAIATSCCMGKIAHLTKADALAHVRKLAADPRQRDADRLVAYRCVICSVDYSIYHVGHRRRPGRRSERLGG
jgi:hypothetical protein